jgi:NAD(P)-dependent dehydrogenase (short-subunit alcohol dehydrogenase family)
VQNLWGQVALTTGGSRGLGLELARQLSALGCRIAICARDADELEPARRDIEARSPSAQVWTGQCEVSDCGQVEALVRRAVERYGRIDILIANAGIISVGPIESVRIEDFERAMNVMFWGVLYPIWAVLPDMMEQQSGKIVTITSIGGKISVPHLVPYSCAKFAAVALSEGLRAELKAKGIDVVTVVPGLMRTGSHLNAEFQGRHQREFAWFGLAASTPGVSMAVTRAARQIVRALRRGESERILTIQAQLLARLHGAFPELTTRVMELVGRMLPGKGDGDSRLMRGLEAQERMNSWLYRGATTFGRSAARENLEA